MAFAPNSLSVRVNESFAEVACMSAAAANELIMRYPEYRGAHGDDTHPFWIAKGRLMLHELQFIQEQVELQDNEVRH